nr:hypothetical protein Iba_scaffold698325CG0010 [Ipomoea batatas]
MGRGDLEGRFAVCFIGGDEVSIRLLFLLTEPSLRVPLKAAIYCWALDPRIFFLIANIACFLSSVTTSFSSCLLQEARSAIFKCCGGRGIEQNTFSAIQNQEKRESCLYISGLGDRGGVVGIKSGTWCLGTPIFGLLLACRDGEGEAIFIIASGEQTSKDLVGITNGVSFSFPTLSSSTLSCVTPLNLIGEATVSATLLLIPSGLQETTS